MPSVFFSGDLLRASYATIHYPQVAKKADVLLHEVFIHDEMPVTVGLRTAKTVENVASYHTLDSVVGKVASEAKVEVDDL